MRLLRDSLQRLRPAMRDTSRQDKAARWLALSEARLAQLQQDAGDAASARTSWLEVAALLEHSERLDPEALAWLSRARFALGRQAEALRVRERLVAAGYHHPQLDARGGIADRR
jgi:hypothetical protein